MLEQGKGRQGSGASCKLMGKDKQLLAQRRWLEARLSAGIRTSSQRWQRQIVASKGKQGWLSKQQA